VFYCWVRFWWRRWTLEHGGIPGSIKPCVGLDAVWWQRWLSLGRINVIWCDMNNAEWVHIWSIVWFGHSPQNWTNRSPTQAHLRIGRIGLIDCWTMLDPLHFAKERFFIVGIQVPQSHQQILTDEEVVLTQSHSTIRILFLKHLTVEIVERAWRQSLFRFWNSMSGRQMWAKMAQRICPWTTKARWSSDESDATCWLVVLWQSCQNEYHDTGIQQNASMMNTNENSPYILQILNPSCTLHVSRDNENQVRHEVYYFVLRRGQSSCTLLHGTFLLYMMGSTLCMILWPLLL